MNIVNLYTSIPLEETIGICLDALYRSDDNTHLVLKRKSSGSCSSTVPRKWSSPLTVTCTNKLMALPWGVPWSGSRQSFCQLLWVLHSGKSSVEILLEVCGRHLLPLLCRQNWGVGSCWTASTHRCHSQWRLKKMASCPFWMLLWCGKWISFQRPFIGS